MELGILLIIVAVVFVGKLLMDKHKKSTFPESISLQTEKIYSNVTELQRYIAEIKKNKKIPTINTSLILKKDEEAYLEDAVKLYEIRSASKSDRLYAGGRIMKGVYLGGSTGISRKFDELREIDSGKLVLTNKRIIFDGHFNNRIMDLEKIISIELYDDGFEIATEDKRQSQLYGGIRDPFLWKNFITAIVKTKGFENKPLGEDDLVEIQQAENELNQLAKELCEKVKKS